LERVAGQATWRQDIRELIDEGWLIRTHEDDSTLSPGFYRLKRPGSGGDSIS
jgi:ribosomal protein L19E